MQLNYYRIVHWSYEKNVQWRIKAFAALNKTLRDLKRSDALMALRSYYQVTSDKRF